MYALIQRSLILVCAIFITISSCDLTDNEVKACNLPEEVVREIASYQPIADQIIESLTKGTFKGSTYRHLSEFVDNFGNRIAGSKNLENAIDYMLGKSKEFGLENVHGEEVQVPHWVR